MRKVPKLRFKEFSDEWEEKKLGEIAEITSGLTPLRSEEKFYLNGTIPWIKTSDLNNSYIKKTEEKISEVALKETSIKLLPKNTLLVAMYGGFNQIGRTGLTTMEATTNQALSAIKFKDINKFPLFFQNVLNYKVDYWKKVSASSRKDPNITKKDIEDFKIFYPKLEEQEKIANFLSSIDKKISLIEEKLELFREYKKGVMQKIFTKELRFKDSNGNDYPEWEEKRLDEVFERIIEKNVENNTNVLTISAQYGLISQIDFFNKSVAGKDLSKYYLLQKGDFAYNKSYSNGYPMGAIKKLKFYEKGIVSTLYICFRLKNKKYSTNYFEQYFESRKIDKNIQEIAQEGARNHGLLNISVQDFFNIYIPFPTLEEQQKIADFLSSIDSKIENIEKELEGLKEFKKGLLQQMFV